MWVRQPPNLVAPDNFRQEGNAEKKVDLLGWQPVAHLVVHATNYALFGLKSGRVPCLAIS